MHHVCTSTATHRLKEKVPISSFASRTHTTHHPTTPGPSRPTPWTDTTFPPLICREKVLGAFWAAFPAVRPWTRREAVLPLPTRRERDSCRLLRAVESAARPGLWLAPRVVASLGTIAPFNTTPAPPLPPCWRRSLGQRGHIRIELQNALFGRGDFSLRHCDTDLDAGGYALT